MIIGLTGGIASGKSLCSDWFAARAIAVVDADVVARTVVHMGSPVLWEIATAFGEDVLQVDGSLNRALLRARAFADEESRARLNAIMQPRIRERLLQELDGAVQQPYCILSVPLLLENGLDRLCDAVLAVDVSVQTQLSRGSRRDRQQRDAIAAIIAAQIPRAERLRRSHFIVVSREPERREEMIARAGGRKTVPQIFIGDTHVGGCDDLHALEAAGKLDALLAG